MKTFKVPEATVERMSIYSRYLELLDNRKVASVSSVEIAEGVGVSPAQVRKDLAYFGEFGTRGVGYNVKDLLKYTLKILGLDQQWNLALVGAGNLGYALSTYKGFNRRGLHISAVFDNDLSKIGKNVGDLSVLPLEKLPEVVKGQNVRIGVITTPAKAAQEVADYMVENGIEAILNFAPVSLNLPEKIEVRNVDVSVMMEILTFNLSFKSK